VRIENQISREAKRLIVRQEIKARRIGEENKRRRKRSTSPNKLYYTQPAHWAVADGFNPYITRARVDRIAHSIKKSLGNRSYKLRPPVLIRIPKSDGEPRPINIYQVADSAVSKMVFENILKKNVPLLSAKAFAYRKDLSAQNAIQYIKSEFSLYKRLFVAEYDFREFFDTIDHSHLRKTMDSFLLTKVEHHVINCFLSMGAVESQCYNSSEPPIREKGIPQGTSISLFLANIAAWDLDRQFERVGVGFTRYADDILLWSPDYEQVNRAVDTLYRYAAAMGVEVNEMKSAGIRLLVEPDARTEMESTTHVEYLGYRLGLRGTGVKESSITRMKTRIETMIYENLLREPLQKTQKLCRVSPTVDRDYVSIIFRLRRYLYGDLSEAAVRRFQFRDTPLRRFKGAMSWYPLIDDLQQLRELDQWIVTRLWLAIQKRGRLLTKLGFIGVLPPPHGVERSGLSRLRSTSSRGDPIDLSIPSTQRIARIILRAAEMHGPSEVGQNSAYDWTMDNQDRYWLT